MKKEIRCSCGKIAIYRRLDGMPWKYCKSCDKYEDINFDNMN